MATKSVTVGSATTSDALNVPGDSKDLALLTITSDDWSGSQAATIEQYAPEADKWVTVPQPNTVNTAQVFNADALIYVPRGRQYRINCSAYTDTIMLEYDS